MHLKKLMSASLALCMTATSLVSAGVFSATAAGEKLTFDIRSGDKNTVTVSAKELETGAYTVPVSVYIPENPGLCAMNLKFQVNDGQIDKNNAFQNYGFTLKGGQFAEPNVFASKEGEAPMAYFSDTNMNLTWVYAGDGNTNGVAAAEANTTAWAKSVSWAYENAFLVTELVVPAKTPAGEYSFTIRTEPFVNAMSIGSEKQQMSRSKCKGANVNDALEFTVIPLTVKVEEPAATTTTVETTTSKPVTTTIETTTSKPVTTTVETTTSKPVTTTIETTTSKPVTTTIETTTSKSVTTTIETTTSKPVTTTIETTTSKPVTTTIETTTSKPVTTTIETTTSKPVTTTIETTTSMPLTTSAQGPAAGEFWKDDYKITMEGVSHYFIMGDVQAKPGESVSVPVYVYGDTGTAGLNLKFTYDKAMKLEKFQFSKASERAYVLSSESGTELYPASFSAISSNGANLIAQDGKVALNLVFTVPENAKDGTVYAVGFEKDSIDICDTEGAQLDVTVFDGTVTVVTDGKTTLNKNKVTFSKVGETANLTLFNAKGEVKWSSDNEAVAKVDQNGFVISTGKGTAIVTAENNGTKYNATVIVGLFGDANINGELTIEDAKLVLDEHVIVNLTKGKSIITDPGARYNADVNGDGKINDKDAKKILDYVVMKQIKLNPSWYELTGNPNAPDAPAN